jgi:radical SAM protein with 4Fe4S-binding SPASM domain
LETREKQYSVPDDYVIIPKEGWFIFFDPVHFSYTRVNEHGKAILESVGSESSVSEITRRVAAKLGIDHTEIKDQVSNFLENMVSTKFLHEGAYRPEIIEPFDMDSCTPKSLYVSPTFGCNLKCIYCYNREQRQHATRSELTTKEWFRVFDQAQDLGVEVVAFTGGEPLLRKDIFELARYANDAGMMSTVLTNAMLISEDNIDNIAESFGSLALSLDSHVRETNDSLRGKGAYDATINAVRLLQKRERIFTIMAVVTKYNVWDIPGLYRFSLERLNSKNIFTSPYIPNSMDDVDLLPKLEDYMKAMTEVVKVVEDFYGDDRLSILEFHGKPIRHSHCGAAAVEISVDADGSVYPCQAFHIEGFRGGNIRERSLEDIFRNSPIMQQVRHCTVDRIETCRDCDIRNACGGGCRSLAYNLHGKIDSCNSYHCEYLKNMVYNSFWNATCVPADQLKDVQEEEARRARVRKIAE